ncbi:MAG: ATP-binding protein [Deltaproteobacteria bacterium]
MMIAKRCFFPLLAGLLSLPVALIAGISLICAATPHAAFALTDSHAGAPRNDQPGQPVAGNEPDRRQPPRTPPRVAIEACEGKKDGASCTFKSADGFLRGECLSGVENIFSCRPYRGAPPSTAAPEITTDLPPAPPRAPREKGVMTPSVKEPDNQTKRDSPADRPEKELPARQSQVGPGLQQIPAQPATPTSFYDHLGQYASNLGSYLVVVIITAGLTWYAFFRYASVPLRRLRRVTQQLAMGDLSARVGEGLIRRKNEVVELGRDVDRMAERIESLVGAQHRLIRDVSHELRSPLARLNVALELARQSVGPLLSAPFDRIERESERLNELIGQLLMLTKLESESGMIQRTDFDIAALIGEIGQDVDFEAKNNDCRVTTMADEPIQMKGNRELLRQAIENLVRNAVRYTAPGTAVEISLCRKKSGGPGWAHIEVRDQGPGVPDAELQNIFRPFYRVNDARERQSGGAGVGLAISDRAVRLHGGSLRAINSLHGGLIMEMELPLQ